MVSFVQNQKRTRAEIVEPGAHRTRVGLVDQQFVRNQEARESFPSVHGVSALAADFFHVGAVENLEGKTEATFHLIFPLQNH